MEKKNQKLTIIVGCLLLVISVSLAFFIGNLLINGVGSKGTVTTAKIKGATLTVEGLLEFNDLDILPGHKTISSIKVTATGNNELIPYNLVWKGTNGLSQLNYTVYKTSSEVSVSASCEKKTAVQNGFQILSEECIIANIDNLGSAISEGSITQNSTKEILAQDEFITATNDGDAKYYYIVLEYPNLDEDQSSDMGATFTGEVTVEESNATPDVDIIAVYIGDDSGNYTETTDIPQSGYALSDKSTCSNGTIPGWDTTNSRFYADNLTKSGTSCYLYFDKKTTETVTTALGPIEVKITTPDFSAVATTDEGIYRVSDGMYGGTSYYWRGAATTNYVKFAGFCWRIIRINGDGSFRLIYDGATCHANGTSTTDSIAVANTAYNSNYNRSEYVGWKYTSGVQRPTSITSGTDAPIKTALESWYTTNITNNGYDGKVVTAKFCNDRNVASGYVWSSTGSAFNYAGYDRINTNYAPTLSCASLDTYSLKVGLITADEVMYAGGKNASNTSYYLYNGQSYWTMSPYYWNVGTSNSNVNVFRVDGVGRLNSVNVVSPLAVRPVINLNSDIQLSGTGTINDPYNVI